MLETQLVFRNEYRFDLKRVESVLIPYLFASDENQLVITVSAKPTRSYRTSGRIEQILLSVPNKPVANAQVLRFGQQFFNFPPLGQFKLQFFPNFFLGKTSISIHKVLSESAD